MSGRSVRFPGWSGGGGRRDDERERRRRAHLYWIAIASLVLVAVGTVTRLVPLVDGDEAIAPAGTAGQLLLAQAEVRNGQAAYAPRGDGRDVQTQATMPTIDLTLLNRGTRRVLLTEARLEVVDAAAFPACQQGGGGPVPVSGAYTIELPPVPLHGAPVVRRPLHQQIGPDAADRVLLRFAMPVDGRETPTLYALRVSLVASEGAPIAVGRFVIATPSPPGRSGYVFPEDDRTLEELTRYGPPPLVATWCFRRNLAELRRVSGRPGRRGADVAALRDVTLAPRWDSFADPAPARVAAQRLLTAAPSDPDQLQLALFAAEQTGDAAFADAMRGRVAGKLLASARRDVARQAWWTAAYRAREALALDPSPEARRLLADAERHLRLEQP